MSKQEKPLVRQDVPPDQQWDTAEIGKSVERDNVVRCWEITGETLMWVP